MVPPKRLKEIYEGISEVVAYHKPNAVAVEGVFYAKNVRTTVILGHAAMLSSTLPAMDPGREDVECIAAAARRLAGVVSQISRRPAAETGSDKLQPTVS